MRVGNVEGLKSLRISLNCALKGTPVSLLIFVVAALLLATPWYPVATTQRATNTFSQIFTRTLAAGYQVSSISLQSQTVYTLASPITIQGTQNVLNPGSWTSNDFKLEVGSFLSVNFTGQGVVGICEDFSRFASVDFTLNGKPPSQGNATVPESGPYHVIIHNFGTSPITATSITVIEETPVIVSSGETNYYTAYSMGFNTMATTETGLVGVAPYSVLGLLPSATILLLIGVVVFFVILIENSIVSVSVGRRRRKRRR